jgi:hypothetical protein
MIGFVVVSDRKEKPTSNITSHTKRQDYLNAALIAFNWSFLMSTWALGFNQYIMG